MSAGTTYGIPFHTPTVQATAAMYSLPWHYGSKGACPCKPLIMTIGTVEVIKGRKSYLAEVRENIGMEENHAKQPLSVSNSLEK